MNQALKDSHVDKNYKDMPKIYQRGVKDMQHISKRYTKDMTKIC